MSPGPKAGEKIADNEDGVYIEGAAGPDPQIVAYNEGGYNSTAVSLRLVIEWARTHRPDLLKG